MDKGCSIKGSSVAAAACFLLLLLAAADDAAAAPVGEVAAALAWRRLEETVLELESLPSELDMIQRRVLQSKSYITPKALKSNSPGCIQRCLPGSQYSVPPPGSHCDRKYYNAGCG
ncbi:hypothetical protein ABZP36_007097 [Zizania latifolia]